MITLDEKFRALEADSAPGSGDCIRLNFSQDHAAAVAAARRIVKMVNIYRK